MAGGRKRASTETGATTRSSKAAKTSDGDTSKAAKSPGKSGKRGAKASMATSAFKSKALPLHLNITHTPPVIASDDTAPATSADPGFIGTTTLIPAEFSTGSYGWKGNKRITIELQNSESGEPEKVQVLLTVNATVIGSKQAAKDDGEGGDEEKEKDEKDAGGTAEEVTGEENGKAGDE